VNKAELDRFLDVPELQGTSTDERGQVEDLLNNPGKSEFFFFRQLMGMTPAQVRTMMIEEFICRFDLVEHADEIRKALPSRRSWRDLDVALAGFAGSMGADDHLQFWDRMRYVLAALPKRKDYGDKYQDGEKGKTAKATRGWNFPTCKLCWRRVSHSSGLHRKAASCCFKHDLPATHSIYRRHSRLAQQLRAEQQSVVKRIMALIAGCSSEADAHKAMFVHLTTPNDCLPRLVDYLNAVGHDGTPESLLWAFHGPAFDITDTRYKEGLNEYIQYVLNAKDIFDPTQPIFIFGIDEMSRAEAWLTLLDRDGRRK
jgi:hypothetical protein